jgi:hypothetical protein
MQYSDWKMISSYSCVFGFFSLIVGLVAYVYYEQKSMGFTFYPFRDYAIPFVIAGFVLLVLGNVIVHFCHGHNET